MNVLITGAAGFIGSNLINECYSLGWNVDGVDDLSNGILQFVNKDVNLIQDDFLSHTIIKNIIDRKYDVVFHLAALPRVAYSVENPIHTHNVNVSKTLELMDVCKGNIDRFIFASSSSVYGNTEYIPTSEYIAKSPRSPYAVQKSMVEEYIRVYHQLYGFKSVPLRFFNVFGPNQLGTSPYATAISSWLTAIYSDQPVRSDGDGTQSRDLTYIDNVVDALIKSATVELSDNFDCFPINVGCGQSVSNNQILDFLKLKFPTVEVASAPARPGDVKRTCAGLQRARSVIGYEPKVSVFEGIEKTIAWFDVNWSWLKGTRVKI